MLVVLFLPQLAFSQDRFSECEKYDEYISLSVKRYWPKGFQESNALKAQLYQESLCKIDAVSPVGAEGIAQFMPATWKEMQSIFGGNYSPRDPSRAIMYAAYYQYRQMKVWKGRDRSYEEQWPLGLCGYNAGIGNCLKAQKFSGGLRNWKDFNSYLCYVTGPKNCHETQTYVIRIKKWRDMIDSYTLVEEVIKDKNQEELNSLRNNFWSNFWNWIKG